MLAVDPVAVAAPGVMPFEPAPAVALLQALLLPPCTLLDPPEPIELLPSVPLDPELPTVPLLPVPRPLCIVPVVPVLLPPLIVPAPVPLPALPVEPVCANAGAAAARPILNADASKSFAILI